MFGARAVQRSILQDFPDADVSVSIVWIEMLPSDSRAAAGEIAETIKDPRVRHFFDPRERRLAGRALARGLIREGAGTAWDIYLFYDEEATWSDQPPRPAVWMHQLGGGRRADPEYYHTGDELVDRLHVAMHRLTGGDCARP